MCFALNLSEGVWARFCRDRLQAVNIFCRFERLTTSCRYLTAEMNMLDYSRTFDDERFDAIVKAWEAKQ